MQYAPEVIYDAGHRDVIFLTCISAVSARSVLLAVISVLLLVGLGSKYQR